MGFILPQEEMGREKVDDMWKREVSTQKKVEIFWLVFFCLMSPPNWKIAIKAWKLQNQSLKQPN